MSPAGAIYSSPSEIKVYVLIPLAMLIYRGSTTRHFFIPSKL
jgi:hypothetical protein